MTRGSQRLDVSECIAIWVHSRISPTREQVLSAVGRRLLYPALLPERAAAAPSPRWQWFLDQFDDGIPLTQTGNLSRSFVQVNAARFSGDFAKPPNTEHDVFELHDLRTMATRLQLARQVGRKLVLTPRGRRLTADPASLWRATARVLISGGEFATYTGELFLALVVDRQTLPASDLTDIVTRAVTEEDFRTIHGSPPDKHDIHGALHHTINRCRALSILVLDGIWHTTQYQLTPVGTATALEALRTRATRGPSSRP